MQALRVASRPLHLGESFGQSLGVFFSSGMADDALRLGPYMRISSSQKHLNMDTIGLMLRGKS